MIKAGVDRGEYTTHPLPILKKHLINFQSLIKFYKKIHLPKQGVTPFFRTKEKTKTDGR